MSATKSRVLDWSIMAERRPLPVQFTLYPSRRMNGALCPCLIVRENGIELIRILDPEHKQPFFSLDSIFLLAGLSIPSGILRFDLHRERGDYDLTLAGLEPREGIWSPLPIAQEIATELDLYPSLKTFFSSKHAWSLDEGQKGGLLHNWQASNEQINPSAYSLNSLCKYPFDTFTILPKGQQINTLLDKDERSRTGRKDVRMIYSKEENDRIAEATKSPPSSSSSFEQRLLRWTVKVIEQLKEVRPSDFNGPVDEEARDAGDIWSPNSVDMLMLFSEFFIGQTDFFNINDGQIVISKNQLREAQVQRTEMSSKAAESNLFEAQTVLVLVDSLWMWYMERVFLVSNSKISSSEVLKLSEQQSTTNQSKETDALNRLEMSMEDIKTYLYNIQRRTYPNLKRPEHVRINQNRLYTIFQSQFTTPLFLGIIIGMLLFQLAQRK